jgi:DNA-binding NarL/FixJ family response regulator
VILLRFYEEATVEKAADHLIKVMILGDDQILRSGLRRILESQSSMVILGEMCIENGTKLKRLLSRRPDVVLVDLDPHSPSVIELISKIRKYACKSAILVMKNLGDEELARQALGHGATSVVLKIQAPSVLLATIESLYRRESEHDESSSNYLGVIPSRRSSASSRLNYPETDSAKLDSLTEREREVVGLIAIGMKNKEIALHLHISDITVRHHLTSIFRKLGVPGRQKLLLLAHQHGLAQPAQ